MGNSEVGHLTIGSGRILFQDLVRVSRAVEDGSLLGNEALLGAFRRAKERDGEVHLLGLVSTGGVHSHISHLRALLDLARDAGMEERTWIHAFTDGRDVSPHAAADDLATLPPDRIATVVGRYYAMDRDKRWERTDRALDAMVGGVGAKAEDPVAAVRASYERGVTDEFVEPVVLRGRPRLDPAKDAVIVFNFRPDRVRQLTQRLLEANADVVTMTRYSDDFDCPVAFGEQTVPDTLAETLSDAGLRQLHAAETEKYAHVTYFFNGGVEEPWSGEERILVPSPRDVASYDLKPEMSAPEVAAAGGRCARRGLRLLRRQLRESGHGRPHRRDSGGRLGRRDGRRLPRPRRRGDAPRRRRLPRDGRPRERREAARGRRREPAHGAHDEPGAARRHRGRRGAPRTAGSSPISRRRSSASSASSSLRAMTGTSLVVNDDR